MSRTQQYSVAEARYRLIRPIAEGQTTSVWLARDTFAGTDVVIKRLTPSAAADPVARARLEEEAAVAARVSHPNAVPLLDAVFNDMEASLVFPFIRGEPLAARIRAGESLDSRQAAVVALDIADALAAAHDSGIVHRDVKSANILVATDGRAHLLDFGIARAVDAGEDADARRALELTGSGMAVGTLPYMAPEQLTGGPPSPAADIYGLGVVMYEMLAGRRPYEGSSPAEQLELQQRPPEPLAAPAVPAALAAFAVAALDPLPERRPTAAQLSRSLRAWLDGRGETEAATSVVPFTAAAPVAAPADAAFGAPRPRKLAPAALAALAALLIGAVTVISLGSALNGAGAPSATPEAAVQAEAASPPPADPPAEAPAVNTAQQPADGNGPERRHPNTNGNRNGGGNNDKDDHKDDDKDKEKDGHDRDQEGGDGEQGNGNDQVGGGNGTERHLPEGER